MKTADFIVIGAGMAGASIAYELSSHGSVILLEREAQPGYHTTGRSAALFEEAYGNEIVRRLTRASRKFYFEPPDGFAGHRLLSPRGTLFIADEAGLDGLSALCDDVKVLTPEIEWIGPADAIGRVEVLRADWIAGAIHDPLAQDIDVHALHLGYLNGLKQRGGTLVCDAGVRALTKRAEGWEIETAAGTFASGILVNAAGAWADEIAALANLKQIGLVPKRRTAITFDPPQDTAIDQWPMVCDYAERFYFKPDAGRIFASPADETPSPPCDAQPEELDIAIAIDRLEQATTLSPKRLTSKWAGLRSFVADKSPVCGFAVDDDRFFWLAGQGGYGIQMAPALARAACALVLQAPLPEDISGLGITVEAMAPSRPGLKQD